MFLSWATLCSICCLFPDFSVLALLDLDSEGQSLEDFIGFQTTKTI
jgi:hypothetical protein